MRVNLSRPGGINGHIPELDGVRAIAVWMVLCEHIMNGWPKSEATSRLLPAAVKFITGHGWLGVDLFFVLSGFLITGILLDSKGSAGYFRNFYARRFLRLIPLYLMVVAVFWISYPGHGAYFVLSLLFLANFAYAFQVGVPHGPGIFWSLAVEEHFYLVWPWVVARLKRRLLACTAAGIVIASPLFRLWAANQGWDLVREIYSYSFFRFDGLALGALIAIWSRTRRANRRNSLALAGAFVGASGALTAVGSMLGLLGRGSVLRYTQAELIFAGFLLAVLALRGSALVSPLRWSFARVSGNLSYCIYLVHLSLGDAYYSILRSAGVDELQTFGPLGLLVVRAAAVLGASFAVALLSRRFLEEPMLRLKRHFEYQKVPTVPSSRPALEAFGAGTGPDAAPKYEISAGRSGAR